MHANEPSDDTTMPAGLLDGHGEFEAHPVADGVHEFVSDLDAAVYFKSANRRHLFSDAPKMVSRKFRAYRSSFGVLGVLAGVLLGVEWVSEFSNITPALVAIAEFITVGARIGVPLFFVVALVAVISILLAFIIVREASFRRQRQLSSEQYALTVGTTHDGLWIWDTVKDEEYFSPRWGQILGYSSADMRQGMFENAVHPDDQIRASQALRGHLGGKLPYDLEIRMYHKEGYYVWVRAKGQAAWDKSGKVIRMAAWITEITERMRAEDVLRETRGQLEAISDNSPSLIYAMDTDSCLLMVNKAYEKFYGVSQDDVLGDSVNKMLDADKAALLAEADQKALTTGKPVELQMEVTAAGGKTKSVQINRFPIFGKDSRIIGIGGVDTDISELKLTQERLVGAMRAAEGANRAKSEFVANMSHELRTPLNAMIGFSEVMASQHLGPIGNDKYHEYAGDINVSGTHLLGIINNMLDLSKIEAGMLELHETIIDVRQTLATCLTVIKGQASKRDLQVLTVAPKNLPALYADERNLKQILINLLANAIKFTPAGGTILVEIEAQANEGYYFKVKDTGIGIAEENVAMVLEPFGQVESKIKGTERGSGLGLPLAKSMVELHGGSFELRSTPNVGTTITVSFPPKRILPVELTRTELANSPAEAEEGVVEADDTPLPLAS